jgi:hypothetical protein
MSENPLLDTIIGINAVSLANVDASLEAVLLVRLAALVAVDAPPSSYLVTFRAAEGTLLELEDARNVLIAVAPIVGTPKVVNAAANIAQALGLALAIDNTTRPAGQRVPSGGQSPGTLSRKPAPSLEPRPAPARGTPRGTPRPDHR